MRLLLHGSAAGCLYTTLLPHSSSGFCLQVLPATTVSCRSFTAFSRTGLVRSTLHPPFFWIRSARHITPHNVNGSGHNRHLTVLVPYFTQVHTVHLTLPFCLFHTSFGSPGFCGSGFLRFYHRLWTTHMRVRLFISWFRLCLRAVRRCRAAFTAFLRLPQPSALMPTVCWFRRSLLAAVLVGSQVSREPAFC